MRWLGWARAREAPEVNCARLLMEKRVVDFAAADTLYDENIFSKNQWEEKLIEPKLAETQYRITQQQLESKSI